MLHLLPLPYVCLHLALLGQLVMRFGARLTGSHARVALIQPHLSLGEFAMPLVDRALTEQRTLFSPASSTNSSPFVQGVSTWMPSSGTSVSLNMHRRHSFVGLLRTPLMRRDTQGPVTSGPQSPHETPHAKRTPERRIRT
jgi:hypothetical protein